MTGDLAVRAMQPPSAGEAPGDHLRAAFENLIGRETFEGLRTLNWRLVVVIPPLLGLISDVSQVLGPVTFYLLLASGAAFLCLVPAIAFRTRLCRQCTFPCVLLLICTFVLGAVVVVQKLGTAEAKGVAGTLIPGVEAFQRGVLSSLGRLDKKIDGMQATLQAVEKDSAVIVEKAEALTETMVQQHGDVMAKLQAMAAQLDATKGVPREAIVRRLTRLGVREDIKDEELEGVLDSIVAEVIALREQFRAAGSGTLVSLRKPADAKNAAFRLGPKLSTETDLPLLDASLRRVLDL